MLATMKYLHLTTIWQRLRVDNPIHWINRYPVGSVVSSVNTYPLKSDLSDG